MGKSTPRKNTTDGRRAWEEAAHRAIGDRADGGAIPLLVDPPAEPDAAYLAEVGLPGAPPYTRGIHPTMYRARLWTFGQYSGFGSAAETNRRFQVLLKGGDTALSVAFDLPTQNGYDPDHTRARGEVGRHGAPIATLGDMRTLVAGVPLDRVSLSLAANATAPILVPMLIAAAEDRGVSRTRLAGTVQNDVLQEYAARGAHIFPPEASLRLAVDLIEFAKREMPQWSAISVSGYHMREAGATAAQEVAFTLANAIAYARAVQARGLAVDEFLPRVSFFFSADMQFLEEIAKFRAARRLWARVVRTTLGSNSPRSQQLRFHVRTAASSLAAAQPELNVVRTAYEALSAVLGGCQSLHTNALNEATGLPTESSARLAVRTQQLIAEESGVASTVDPLGGSYVIEEATDRIEREAREYLDRVEAMGGAAVAVARGFFASEIAHEAYRLARAREGAGEKVVGVNAFTESNPSFSLFLHEGRGTRGQRAGPRSEAEQVARVRAWRRRRSARGCDRAMAELERVSAAEANVVPAVLAAVRAGATLGEITDRWRQVFGEQPSSRAF